MAKKNGQALWWQTGVIYQIYPRSFKDQNGDGIGDLAGVIEKLDYLNETLGVEAVWLSPFYPSPMADFGYDVENYTDIDPIFGDLSIFDELVDQMHRRGLKIIIDLVPNHTSDQHPWFKESRSSRNNPKRGWYVWADPKPDGSPPNNWLSVFGGSAWEWDELTGQYYLHSFLKVQPDLNWRESEVKEAIFGVAEFWLDRGVDGFRIDVAHFILKDPHLHDNPVRSEITKTFHKLFGEYDTQVHLYDKGHPDVHDVYREFRELLDLYSKERPRVALGEIHIFDLEEWVTYYGTQQDELHMPFNFTLLGIEWNAQAVRKLVEALETVLPPDAWPNYVLGNHDESRLASRFGELPARMAAMLLLTLRGTPTLYYGDEIGMTDVPVPPELEQDPWGKRVPGLGRDPARTPMQWSPAPHAGFAPANAQRLWLPVSDNYLQVNVEVELNDPTSILNLYRRLLAYRKSSPALKWGDYKSIDPVPENCFAFLRQAEEGPDVMVVLNYSPGDLHLNLPAVMGGELILSTNLGRSGRIQTESLPLRGYEGVLIELIPGKIQNQEI